VVEQLDLAETKCLCITYRFNNFKLRKIAEKQKEKRHMDKLLVSLKKKLKLWSAFFSSPEQTSKKMKDDPSKAQKSEELLEVEKPSESKSFIVRDFGKESRLAEAIEKEEAEKPKKDSEETFKETYKKLNGCARMMLYLKKFVCNQVIFINDGPRLDKVKLQMEQGEVDIETVLEKRMRDDIKECLAKEDREEDAPVEVKDLGRTRKKLSCCALFKGHLTVYGQIVVSYSEWICYLFMFLS